MYFIYRNVWWYCSSLTTCVFYSKPTPEVLTEYTRKVDFLKGLLEAEKLVSGNSLQVHHWLFFHRSVQSLCSAGSSLISCLPCSRSQSSPTEKALANQFLAPGRTPTIANERMPATKTVHMQTKARCTGEMRDELLGTVKWDVTVLRSNAQ